MAFSEPCMATETLALLSALWPWERFSQVALQLQGLGGTRQDGIPTSASSWWLPLSPPSGGWHPVCYDAHAHDHCVSCSLPALPEALPGHAARVHVRDLVSGLAFPPLLERQGWGGVGQATWGLRAGKRTGTFAQSTFSEMGCRAVGTSCAVS